MLSRTRVIHTYLLASSQWSRYSLASSVDDVCSCAQRETHRTLLASYDDRLAGLIRCYRAGLVSCARSALCCSRRSVCCCRFFGRGCAGLCKCQRRSQTADQSNNCFLHSLLLVLFHPKFVTQRLIGRFMSVFYSIQFGQLSGLAISVTLRGDDPQTAARRSSRYS